jgi:hypothetical protein
MKPAEKYEEDYGELLHGWLLERDTCKRWNLEDDTDT